MINQPVAPIKKVKPKTESELNQTFVGLSGYTFISGVQNDFPVNTSENERKMKPNHEQLPYDENIARRFNLHQAVIFSEL